MLNAERLTRNTHFREPAFSFLRSAFSKLQPYLPGFPNRNVKGLIKFHFNCKAFAKSGNELNTRSIAGSGIAWSGWVVFTNTV
jgi:hypothetical protein